MARFPALPLWTDAYLADTPGPSPETWAHHGLYLILLMAAWRRPNCDLPDDDDWLRLQICGGNTKGLRNVRRILGMYWKKERSIPPEDTEYIWVQSRLRNERFYITARSETQRRNVKKRWDNSRRGDTTEIPPTV